MEQEATTKIDEPVPEKYLEVSDDPKSAQYGLSKYVKVDGEWIEAEVYVARCKAPIRKVSPLKRPDGSPIYDITRDAADWNDELKRIEWPEGKEGKTAVFLGIPRFGIGLSYDKKNGGPVVDSSTLSLKFNSKTWSFLDPTAPAPPAEDIVKLKMIYRDIQGKTATNCVVYLVDED